MSTLHDHINEAYADLKEIETCLQTIKDRHLGEGSRAMLRFAASYAYKAREQIERIADHYIVELDDEEAER